MADHDDCTRRALALEKRLADLELRVTTLTSQLNGARKLFFKDRQGTMASRSATSHSDLKNRKMVDSWLSMLPK